MSGDTLREAILDLLRAENTQPMTKSELARTLSIAPKNRANLRKTLEDLVQEGKVDLGKKSRYSLHKKHSNTLVGTLKFHPKGHAFFFPDASDENLATGIDLQINSRIHIPRRDAGTALDGDRVQITVRKPSPRREFRPHQELKPDRPEELRGNVDKILERRSGRLVGTFHDNKGFRWIETDDKAVDGRIGLIGDTTAQPGQLVVVALESWDNPNADPRGRIIEVLGWPGDAGVDMISIIHRFGLATSFPDDVLAEARAVPELPSNDEIKRRDDWRDKLVITIDPADAKDHDDAIWCQRNDNGWTLAVHIADVSHYIKPGTPMDKEAIKRGNSTYLADRVLPMLPVELSNGICSLKPDVDRLTKCALMEISRDGRITSSRFLNAVIHSRAKLSYQQAQAILDGKPAPENSDPQLVPMVREGWKMAAALRKRRFLNGALDLEMPEIKIRLDDNGRAVGADPVIHTESHQLVEECMLAANEAVAHLLKVRGKPAVYRIHEDPDPSRLIEYAETAMLHGYRPGDLTNRSHIQKLLDQSKGRPEEHIIKLGLLKSLKRAAYAAEPLGHYGLAKSDYGHFTSPIRRYADLIVHRALQPLLENPPQKIDRNPSQNELRDIARHISDTERTSGEAEGESRQLKLFEYLGRIAEMHEPFEFNALVTDCRMMGLMVEIPEMGLRGVVKREDLGRGRWWFENHNKTWTSGKTLIQPGMRVPLHVSAIDRIKRFVDFTLAGPPLSPPPKPLKVPPNTQKHRGKPQPKAASKAGPPARRTTTKKTAKSPKRPPRKLKHRRR
ncbi:MAG: ribonuclease R family protein [Verrucomicrobiota bacterium JB025]|nr:VacB/RNase II family 3'-5' exoribonuclease [Verrucomicrobiota bacterium JB025]